MQAVRVPRIEFYGLVNNIDNTIYMTLERTKLDKVDETSLEEGIDSRINEYFNEFTEKFPEEDLEKAKEVAVNGIPDYIQAARENPVYNRKWNVIGFSGFGVMLVGFLSVGIVGYELHNDIMEYIGLALVPIGLVAAVSSIIKLGKKPLNNYREQYKNQIIEAYQE